MIRHTFKMIESNNIHIDLLQLLCTNLFLEWKLTPTAAL